MENDIKRHEGDNLGGIYTFKFLPVEGIGSMPESYKGAVHKAVTVAAGYRWFDGYCSEESMKYTEEQEDSENGAFFKKTFTGNVPKDREEVVDTFETMKNRRYILDITYNNGVRKLVGTADEPLYFSSKFDTSKPVSGRHDHAISFSGGGIKKSPIYSI